MSDLVANSDMLDPHLQKMLQAYGVVPKRDLEAAGRTRAKFIADLNSFIAEPTIPRSLHRRSALSNWALNIVLRKNSLRPFPRRRLVAYMLIFLMTFGVFLFGTAAISAYAASSSLPGDILYPVKTMMENARLDFTLEPASRARLYLDNAGQRLTEIQLLLERGRYDDIALATAEFEKDVQRALAAADRLAQTDPARALVLHAEIEIILQDYVDILIRIFFDLPDDVKPIVHDAIIIVIIIVADDDNDGESGVPTPGPKMTATPTPSPKSTATSVVPTATSTPVPFLSATPVSSGGTGDGDDDKDDDDHDDEDDDDDD